VVLAGGILFLLLLVVFSLLPTLLFNPKIITNGVLLKKYATEFQQENARSNQ
ncbi:membrane protein, putative, partial [Listeria monocytogenes FSL F2-208]